MSKMQKDAEKVAGLAQASFKAAISRKRYPPPLLRLRQP